MNGDQFGPAFFLDSTEQDTSGSVHNSDIGRAFSGPESYGAGIRHEFRAMFV